MSPLPPQGNSAVAVNIAKVRENLSNYGAVQLIAVTKNATIDQIGDAFACGVNHFGESRVQAALKKLCRV